ncbi:MAG TPA: GNAT family N-acetyltransferase [Alphaproteobacteria bacterium]|nr:GNAT family N-acetyltransferase [Alphaproteobacteria bacterium]
MLRQEIPEDYKEVERLVYSAFENSSLFNYQEITEHKLVAKLRESEGFVPELSIVVQEGWEITGHILLTKVNIKTQSGELKEVLALAPMSVMPVLQKTGVGLQLIMESTEIAKKLGFGALVVLGHKEYYPKHGFKLAKNYDITCNIDDVEDFLFIKELKDGYLHDCSGVIEYPAVFFE